MSPDEIRDQATIADLIHACELILEFTQAIQWTSFCLDKALISAVSFQILILGEAVGRLSDGLRGRHPNIPWRQIAGIRNHMIHGYDDIDLAEVWKTASQDVPKLLSELRRIQSVIQ